MTRPPEDLVCVGAIAGAFGVRGEARVKSFCAEPRAIADYAPLRTADGREVGIAITRELKGAFAARLSIVSTREEAEALRGTRLYAPRDRLPSNHVIAPAHLFDGPREPSRPIPGKQLRRALIRSGDRAAHRRMRRASAVPKEDISGEAADTASEGTKYCACSRPPTWKLQLKRNRAVSMRGVSRFYPERRAVQFPLLWIT